MGILKRLNRIEELLDIATTGSVAPTPEGHESGAILTFCQVYAYPPGHIYHVWAQNRAPREVITAAHLTALKRYFSRWDPPFDFSPAEEIMNHGGNPYEELGLTLLEDGTLLPPGYRKHTRSFIEERAEFHRLGILQEYNNHS